MKKTLLVFCWIFATTTTATQGIMVPTSIEFADVKLRLSDAARANIQKKISSLTLSPRHFQNYLDRCDLYFPVIEEAFKEERLPADFKYLGLQESALVSTAISKSNAVGYWQFKDFTAIEVGMRVDERIDERQNIYASSKGAAIYLKKNNYILRNWVYAMLSYNLGLTGARNFMGDRFIGATEMDITGSTHFYILHYLAHKLAFEGEVGKNNPRIRHRLVLYPKVRGKSLADIASLTRISVEDLRYYNEWVKADGMVPNDRDYTVILPVPTERVEEVKALLNQMSPGGTTQQQAETVRNEQKPAENTTPVQVQQPVLNNPYPKIVNSRAETYGAMVINMATINGLPGFVASRGQDVTAVASALKIPLKRFLKINDMKPYDGLTEGQVYYLKPKQTRGPEDFHTTQMRESLWDISQRYGVRLANLTRNNRIGLTEDIVPGRVIWLRARRPAGNPEIRELPPAPTPQPVTTPATTTDRPAEVVRVATDTVRTSGPNNEGFHIVKDGENIYAISRQYNVTIMELKEWNNLPDDLRLEKGKILVVQNPKANVTEQPAVATERVRIDSEGRVINENTTPATTTPGTTPAATTRPAGAGVEQQPRADERQHTVRAGENLVRISDLYGVTVRQIMNRNSLLSTAIDPGMVLIIPASSSATLPPAGTSGTPAANTTNVFDQPAQPATGTTTQPAADDPFNRPAAAVPTTATPAGAAAPQRHTVAAGQTLFAVSRQYGVSVANLRAWNNLTSDVLSIGQEMIVSPPAAGNQSQPAAATVPATSPTDPFDQPAVAGPPTTTQPATTQPVASQPVATQPSASGTHTVQKGQTLFAISRMYGVSVQDLTRWNNLPASGAVQEGQVLQVSGTAAPAGNTARPATATPAASQQVWHTVKSGDTMFSLSRQYNVSVNQIKLLNNRQDNTLKLGEKIRVK